MSNEPALKPSKAKGGSHYRKVQEEQRAERTKKEMELRRLGYSYREIGEQLGVDYTVVFDDVKREMTKLIAEIKEDCEQVRQMELDRIDSVLPGVIEAAKGGELKAIDAMVKLMDRRSKYLGLDAAQKQDTSGIVTVYLRESQKEEL